MKVLLVGGKFDGVRLEWSDLNRKTWNFVVPAVSGGHDPTMTAAVGQVVTYRLLDWHCESGDILYTAVPEKWTAGSCMQRLIDMYPRSKI